MSLADNNLKGYGTYTNNSGSRNEEEFSKLTEDCVLCTGGVIDPYDNVRYAVLPFTDVVQSDVYYDAVYWAYENAIAAGVTAARFSPLSTWTARNGDLFMAEPGRPAPEGKSRALPTVRNAYYSDALTWAVEKRDHQPTGGGRFHAGPQDHPGQI